VGNIAGVYMEDENQLKEGDLNLSGEPFESDAIAYYSSRRKEVQVWGTVVVDGRLEVEKGKGRNGRKRDGHKGGKEFRMGGAAV